uniref:Cadherin domain-containing protein n=1 Tax=Acrobeloides nanus TaxID=290746 RepID=A0A914CZ52_9BILA
MKDTWLRLTSIFLFLLFRYSDADENTCSFPESEVEPFFFDVRADTLPDSVIVDTVVEPPDAKLKIVNIRTNNLPHVDFTHRFYIESRENGQFMLINKEKLNLPDFPSMVNETYLYLTVSCNNKAYPLITLRIRNYNTWTPRFYMMKDPPYEMILSEDTPPGSVIDTSVLALDRDPAPVYMVTYKIMEGIYKTVFNISTSPTLFHRLQSLPKVMRNKHFLPEQLPPVVQLHVLERLRKGTYYLNISATDNGTPSKIAYTTLKLIVKSSQPRRLEFTEQEYHANFTVGMSLDSELFTDFPIEAKLKGETFYRNEKAPIILYELMSGDYSQYFHLDPKTARLTLREKLSENTPSSIQLKIKAYVESDLRIATTAILWLSDISETVISFFTECSYEVTMKENVYPDTEVVQLQFRGYADHFQVLNAQEYFDVNSDGMVIVKQGLDREQTEQMDFQVKLVPQDPRQPQPEDLCYIATIRVNVEDENDNNPKCEKLNYIFYAEEVPFNNTEIGRVKAVDKDKGLYGQVKYRILGNEFHDLPFTLFEADGAGIIYYVVYYPDFWPESMYSFTIEAYDATENPRACRATVQVILGGEGETSPTEISHLANNEIRARAKSSNNRVASSETRSLEALPNSRENLDDFHPDLPEFHSKESLNSFQPESTTDYRIPKESKEKEVPKTRIYPKNSAEEFSNGVRRNPKKNSAENLQKSKNPTPPKVIKFEKDSYKFKVYGVLDAGRYVGTIRVPGATAIEYALEEGIMGFFHLDPLTGYLTVGEELLKDTYEEVRFSAVARKNGRDLATTLVTVYLDESTSIFEAQPQFEQALYRFEIQENSSPQDIGQVTAHHRSIELGNDQADYELRVNEDSRGFSIDSDTGIIRSEEYFDWETQKLYTLQVTACLRKNQSLCGETDVIIVILDVNDNYPEFSQPSYSVTLPQDIPPNTEILRVNATDRDSGKNGQIHFKLDDSVDLFKIDEKTGAISLKNRLPIQDVGHFSLSVSAEDEGDPPLKSYADVNIETGSSEMNPNAPEFEKFRYDDIVLNAPVLPNTEILTVHATDPDSGPAGEIKYHIDSSNGAQFSKKINKFEIDENNGKIFTVEKITPEDGPVIQFIVEAVDQSPTFPRKTQTVVMLTIKGQEKEFVEFNPLPKIVFISTDKPVGSTIISVSATSHRNQTIEFSLLQGSNKLFGLAENQLVVTAPLVEGHYNLTIRAMVENTNLFTEHRMKIVVMTDRDKYPVFERLGYNFEVPINSAFPLKLPPVNATVRNGHITYEIYRKEKLPRGISIDKITGQLTIFEEFVPAFNAQGNVFVVIRARNVDYQTFFSDVGVTLILVDIDKKPAFTSKLFRLMMQENTFPGTVISEPLPLKKPEDFPDVKWSISPSDKFSITEDGSIVVDVPIDLEKMDPASKGVIDLTVTAQSSNHTASTKVQIKVEDVNEVAPVFLQRLYKFNVKPDAKPGDVIGQVKAKDEDFTDKDAITYRIFDDDPNPQFRGFFQINNKTGEIVLTNKQSLIPRIYTLRIEAADSQIPPNTGLVQVNISVEGVKTTPGGPDVIEMPEEKWEITEENGVVGSNIVVHGLPNANWEFQIVGGNEAENFKLKRLNDTMALVEIITAPSKDNQTIVVQGVNIANPSQIIRENISVDLTKLYIPQFILDNEPITADITMPPFMPIFTALAEQPSNRDPVTYSLVNNPNEMFWIDTNNGSVYFCCAEGRVAGVYDLKVKAIAANEISGTSYSATNTYEILVSEGVSTVLTSRKPGTSSRPETSSRASTSSRTSVEQTLRVSSPSSRKTTTGLKTSPSTSSKTTSILTSPTSEPRTRLPTSSSSEDIIHFESDHYTFPINQEPVEGMMLGHIYLLNFKNTSQISMQISPEEFEPFFDIEFDPVAGTITLFLNKIPPFVENLNVMEFNVTLEDLKRQTRSVTEVMILWNSMATTKEAVSVITSEETESTEGTRTSQVGGETETTSKTSQVTDGVSVTVVPPTTGAFVFAYPQYSAILPEGKYGSGGSLVTMKPQRLAIGLPPNIEYRIFSIDPTLPFFIRSDNGEIYVFGEIDREKIAQYNLTIMAMDDANPSNVARTQVIVKILDVNDNYPMFVNPPYVIPVATNTPVGTNVSEFQAKDADSGKSGEVTFKLVENYHDIFAINKNGELMLAKPVPQMEEENVFITIEAIDGGRPALRTAQRVEIEIFPETVSQPMFKKTDETVTLPASATNGTFIKQLVAGTIPLKYGIQDSHSNLFAIDDRGVITLGRKPLDSERGTFYDLNITATDQNGNVASTLLHVKLEGIPGVGSSTPKPPKMPCRFPVKIYNTEVPENQQGKRKLTKVTSSCEIERKPVKYLISQGEDMFEIDENTGDLFVTKELDREKKSLHFIVVNATVPTATRKTRQLNAIAEFTKNKLADNQALVVVRVIDENDNPPAFQKRNPNNEYVFNVDWQANILRPIARIEVHDPDEKSQLKYSISPEDSFMINATHGVIYVKKSLSGLEQEVFDLVVSVSDGKNEISTPVKIYVLAPGINLVVLGVDKKPEDIDDLSVERKLTELLGIDTHVLIKQIFLQEDGKPDENKSHLFVYATDKNNVPLSAETLKELIEKVVPILKESGDLPLMNITLPAVYRKFQLSVPEIILLVISAILLFTACLTLFCLLRYCKRRFMLAKSDTEYMVDSTTAGPRPYNVELISRKTAQNILSSRSLPDPYEEIKMSPESRATMIASSGLLVTDHPPLSAASSHRNEAINPITGSSLLIPAEQSEGEISPGSTIRPPSTVKSET